MCECVVMNVLCDYYWTLYYYYYCEDWCDVLLLFIECEINFVIVDEWWLLLYWYAVIVIDEIVVNDDYCDYCDILLWLYVVVIVLNDCYCYC